MILWKPGALNPWLASFRYRVALPLLGLEKLGVRSKVRAHQPLFSLQGIEAIVFSKALQPADLALARRARELRIPILCDLCDNVFVDGYSLRARLVFEQIAALAAVVVTTNSALAELIAKRVGGMEKVVVIPDSVETPDDVATVVERFRVAAHLEIGWRIFDLARRGARFLAMIPARLWLREGLRRARLVLAPHLNRARRTAANLRQRADRQADAAQAPRSRGDRAPASPAREKLVTWFGNHGGEHADYGMLDVLIAAPALAAISKRIPLRLRIISNDRGKYARHIAPLPLPTEYLEWHPLAVHRQIRESDVVILPSTLNEFTRCKSSNRALLALHSGVPVVATRTPATSALEDCAVFDDWERGIESYLTDARLRESHLDRARQVIAQSYAAPVVARRWREAFEKAAAAAGAEANQGARAAPVLVLLINLVQDLELILPLFRAAARRACWNPELWVTANDLLKRPEMLKRLEAAGIPYHLVDPALGPRGGYPRQSGLAALISASESTADPHLHAHQTVLWARRLGVRTYTMQHGFQNIGLTYGDERFPVESVRFASDVVFLWGTLDSLHARVRRETRAKCLPVGCPKPLDLPTHALPVKFAQPLVAVFENLHSARYADPYRERFVADLQAAAKARPDLRFLVKPHPAGRWLTSRQRPAPALPENVLLADPQSPQWINVSAADILAQAAAVITSVTTVAFDAARAGMPVAVAGAGYRRDLSSFRPLTILQAPEDWNAFMHAAVDRREASLGELSRAFARKAVLEGDATQRILDAVERDVAPKQHKCEDRAHDGRKTAGLASENGG